MKYRCIDLKERRRPQKVNFLELPKEICNCIHFFKNKKYGILSNCSENFENKTKHHFISYSTFTDVDLSMSAIRVVLILE